MRLSAIEQSATPSNLRLGQEILAQGGVEWLEKTDTGAIAKVGIGQRRTVHLSFGPTGVGCHCTCTRKRDALCKHCVAATLAIRQV